MNVAQNIGDLVGNTPIVKLNNIDEKLPANIYGKCEFMNPTSSVKDRIGFNMINQALLDGQIDKSTHIIEPTSGNTGIGLAAQCASLGMKLTLTMPESMSIERRKLLKAFGANLVLTEAAKGMKGAIEEAERLNKEDSNSIILQQFANPNNPAIHEKTTAVEILNDMDKKIDILVAGIGTGGTITGTSKVLKQHIPNLKVVAVEPCASPFLSEGKAGPHKIQGIGAGFAPDILDKTCYDEIITISNEDAIEMAKKLALTEGLLVGISSGANVCAAIKLASKEEYKDKNIVTILCDTGERYLSTDMFSEED